MSKSSFDYNNDIIAAFLRRLKPPVKTLPSRWANDNLYLPASSNARSGRISLSNLQKQMIDAATEPGVKEIIFCCSSQIGKSVSILALLGWSICGEGNGLLLVRPDIADTKSYQADILEPTFKATPAIRNQLRGRSTTDTWGFIGGNLFFASAWKPSSMAGKACRVAFLDELDRMPRSSGKEGSPVDLTRQRLTTFGHKGLLVVASTPTIDGDSPITDHYKRGDCRVFNITCRECGDTAPLTKERLYFEPGRAAETAALKCFACGCVANEAQRLRMIEQGRFVATNPNGERGVLSFHCNALASEFISLAEIAEKVDNAKDAEAKKSVANLVWGEAYTPANELEMDADILAARAIPIRAPYPGDIDHICAAIDCQGAGRLEVMYMGQIEATRARYVLDRVVIPGDPSADAVWRKASLALDRTFQMDDRREIAVTATVCDAGYATQKVLDFCNAERQRGKVIYPIFGRAKGFGKAEPIKQSALLRGTMHGLILNVDEWKLAVVKALQREPGTEDSLTLPDHLGDKFYAQYAAEKLALRYLRTGRSELYWEKTRGQANEAHDLSGYCFALLSITKGRSKSIAKSEDTPQLSIAQQLQRINQRAA